MRGFGARSPNYLPQQKRQLLLLCFKELDADFQQTAWCHFSGDSEWLAGSWSAGAIPDIMRQAHKALTFAVKPNADE